MIFRLVTFTKVSKGQNEEGYPPSSDTLDFVAKVGKLRGGM